MSSIVVSDLDFSWPDGTPVFEGLSFTVPEGRTGLVAPNGAGKSTLLRLIAGDLRPASGSVLLEGSLGYLPQTLPLRTDLTVAQVLGSAPVLAAIAAVEAGDVAEEHFGVIGNDWDIAERSEAHLTQLGLSGLAPERPLDSLSGGQILTLGLAAQLLRRPQVLLLDEPTNNLDRAARQRLYEVVSGWRGCLLVVSHDRELLERMDRIAELGDGELDLYGGPFSAYLQAVRAEQDSAERAVDSAEREIKRHKREQQQARERAARRASTGARHAVVAGLPKIVAGAMKRRAQESAGRADGVHAARAEAARTQLAQAQARLRDEPDLDLDLPDTAVPAGRTLFEGKGIQVVRGGRELFAPGGVALTIRGPERIALVGANGVGKSSLLRVINGELAAEADTITSYPGRIAYLSQRLDLLDENLSVLANLQRRAPGMSVTRRRHLLAKFAFGEEAVDRRLAELSGGERLRATLVCVLFADEVPTLLLLDEPTNNLDLVSVSQLTAALGAYRGALLIVSHDERLLSEIGVTRRLRLADGQLLADDG